MKKIFFQGILAGAIASIFGIIYLNVYQSALLCDFTEIINPVSITVASTIGCLLMSAGCAILFYFRKLSLLGWLYFLISVLSLISIMGPISSDVPVEVSNPQLFPGLIAPLHLFPALSFFMVAPLFKSKS